MLSKMAFLFYFLPVLIAEAEEGGLLIGKVAICSDLSRGWVGGTFRQPV